jgi:hypothetical protein
MAAHPSGRFDVNGNHFQLAMLAYNLNCWLLLFNREPQADASALRHTTGKGDGALFSIQTQFRPTSMQSTVWAIPRRQPPTGNSAPNASDGCPKPHFNTAAQNRALPPGRFVARASGPAGGTSSSPCWCGSGVG